MAKKAQPSPGNLTGLILAVLEEESLHGYAIAREIENKSENILSCGEGALYPALRELAEANFVVSSWETSERGPARKVYSITPSGKSELIRIRQTWADYARSVENILGNKLNPRSSHS